MENSAPAIGMTLPVPASVLTIFSLAENSSSSSTRQTCGVSGRFSVFERTYFMQIMGAVFFTTLALIENDGSVAAVLAPATNLRFLLAVLFLALGASVAGYSMFNYAVSHAPMANVIVFMNLATVVSVAAGIIVLHERLAPVSLVAMVVVLIGIWGVQKYPPKESLEG